MEDHCAYCNKPHSIHARGSQKCPGLQSFYSEKVCKYEVRKGTYDTPARHCLKKTAGPDDYCPKHRVMVEGEQLELEKKMQKLRDRKGFKAEMRKVLETSPLKGYNPLFDDHKNRTYSR